MKGFLMEKIESLLNEMTLEEKVSLAAGADFWRTVPIERLGIPAIKVTDGPNGARGESFNGKVTSACFPVGIAMASTWNTELVERVGKALAEEVKSKGAVVLLAPTVNIHRSPVNGRNFECYSEDPYLSARIAVAYVKGLQNEGVSACIKHFVCNDSEFERMSMSSEVTERALREIYLPPFHAAVKEAGVWAIMSAYNKVNGTSMSENSYLLRDVLKGEWGFDGLVMSDWFGTYSENIANGGLDLEMPGPARWMGDSLLDELKAGRVSEETVNDKVRRLLRLMIRTNSLDTHEAKPEEALDRPEHRVLLREVAAESIVLLKNENAILPISQVEKVAVIGYNATTALIQGGGSAGVRPHYKVTPFEGISKAAEGQYEIAYELGATSFKMVPVMDAATVQAEGGMGMMGEFFTNQNLEGEPISRRRYETLNLLWIDDIPEGVNRFNFSARFTGVYTAKTTGTYKFSLVSAGLSRLFIDGKEVLNNWENWQKGDAFFAEGSIEAIASVELQKGQSYSLVMEYSNKGATIVSAVRLGCLTPQPADMLERAVQLASESDIAIVFAGLGEEWESEGYDRPTINLPASQNELIEKVAEANPRTVVVLNVGAPVAMPWLDKVAGVLLAWYGGQEMGNAIADVLFGKANPSGKLSETFPIRLEDNPAYINYPGENGKVYYGEGIFVGYRYYEKKKVEPLFPFGYGLSYTDFAYSNLEVTGSGTDVQVSVDVRNIGNRAGQEVVQLYVRDPQSKLVRPEKELKAFAKVVLDAGETKTVSLTLKHDAFAYYDPAKKAWVAEAGAFEILLGASSADIRLSAVYELVESLQS
jgi:beta-glucosidase